ncbi:MAG TPA: hypothetical protein VIZ28_08060 [Chitinophagaceae bacterium]
MRFFILLLLISLISCSQKIITQIDKSKNEKIIKANSAIRPTIIAPLSIQIKSVGKEIIFIKLYGEDVGANAIGADATATFLLDDKTTITIYSIGVQGYDRSIKDGKYYSHHYRIAVSDFTLLSKHLIIRIRKSDSTTYYDFDIKNKDAEKFKKLQLKFLEEFNNQ